MSKRLDPIYTALGQQQRANRPGALRIAAAGKKIPKRSIDVALGRYQSIPREETQE